jgi:hypothetical protein
MDGVRGKRRHPEHVAAGSISPNPRAWSARHGHGRELKRHLDLMLPTPDDIVDEQPAVWLDKQHAPATDQRIGRVTVSVVLRRHDIEHVV